MKSEPIYQNFNPPYAHQVTYHKSSGADYTASEKPFNQSEHFTQYAHGTGKVSLKTEEPKTKKCQKGFKQLHSAENLATTLRKQHYQNVEVRTNKRKERITGYTTSWIAKTGWNLPQHLGQESIPTEFYTLVSHGEPKDNCGEIRAKLLCKDTDSFIGDMNHCCHRADCPVCWDSWVEREVKSASEKFLAGLDLLQHQNVKNQGHHIVFSVPPEEYGLSVKQLRGRLLYRMRWVGAVASAIIFHPFRFRSLETGYEVQWKHCSLNRNAESPIVESEAYYSPHFHTACVGYLVPSRIFYGGGMWKRPTDKKPRYYKGFRWRYYKQNTVPLDNPDRIRRMLWYSLSHCGTAVNKHALTWGQKFGNRHMLIDTRTHEIEYPKCPIKKCPCFNTSDIVIEYQKDLGEYVTAGQRELHWIVKTKTTYKFNDPGAKIK